MELKGKIANFLGDSITEGCGVNDAANRYDRRIEKECGLAAANNYGIGGTRIAYRTTPSWPKFDQCFCGRMFGMDKRADLIVVFGGTNDYGHGDAAIGGEEDGGPATFFGALNFMMTWLKVEYPKATIVFMTPCRRWGDENISGEREKSDRNARPLLSYVDAMIKAGKKNSVPVLDLYHNLGIDPNDEEQRKKYTADGLHLNDEGHRVLAEKLIEFLKAL